MLVFLCTHKKIIFLNRSSMTNASLTRIWSCCCWWAWDFLITCLLLLMRSAGHPSDYFRMSSAPCHMATGLSAADMNSRGVVAQSPNTPRRIETRYRTDLGARCINVLTTWEYAAVRLLSWPTSGAPRTPPTIYLQYWSLQIRDNVS